MALAQQAILDRVSPQSSALSNVVVRLLTDHADHGHTLNVTSGLLNPQRRGRLVNLLAEVSGGYNVARYGDRLDEFLQDHPGSGPLFQPIPADINMVDDEPRKRAFERAARQAEPARGIGPEPTLREAVLLDGYSIRLANLVQPAAEEQINRLAAELSAETGAATSVSARTKQPSQILDKVRRMRHGRPGKPGRADFCVGDVIDAVGVRLTVPDMRTLAMALDKVVRRLGVGQGGQILEIENMYAEPKSAQPAYRVIPLIVAIEVDGERYTYELQLTTERASVAADIEHNTLYKPYIAVSPEEERAVRRVLSEAAALDQLEMVERNDDE